ncbi:hypothetical protein WN51_02979 [Melipona quadrifasciata]|uniref:Uncharacterized protein n=1 Tax=Melipona quadrifasciata TaxID=166423 RepID=A0A0N0BEG0_9HYME|nr:hypothetical protein WN51_02979 [Melipona quadrifasciata]
MFGKKAEKNVKLQLPLLINQNIILGRVSERPTVYKTVDDDSNNTINFTESLSFRFFAGNFDLNLTFNS